MSQLIPQVLAEKGCLKYVTRTQTRRNYFYGTVFLFQFLKVSELVTIEIVNVKIVTYAKK